MLNYYFYRNFKQFFKVIFENLLLDFDNKTNSVISKP